MKRNILFFLSFLPVIIVSGQVWQTDLETAKSIASEKHRKIVLVFQGSDWCAPCIKLDREIWSTSEFTDFAEEHYVMVRADFPKKKANALTKEQQAKNNQLAEEYNSGGIFPFVVVMDSDGHILGKTGYQKVSPSEYIKHLESFKA